MGHGMPTDFPQIWIKDLSVSLGLSPPILSTFENIVSELDLERGSPYLV